MGVACFTFSDDITTATIICYRALYVVYINMCLYHHQLLFCMGRLFNARELFISFGNQYTHNVIDVCVIQKSMIVLEVYLQAVLKI